MIDDLGSVSDVRGYLDVVLGKSQQPDYPWMFRGQRRRSWSLVAKIDRKQFNDFRRQETWERLRHEGWLLKEFQKAARPHLTIPPANSWEWLAMAQHHGLATRLLDWTSNPLAALFFSVEASSDGEDSAVWCYQHKGLSSAHRDMKDPFTIPDIVAFDPPHVSPRITVQAGRFTAHPELNSPWKGILRRVMIEHNARSSLRASLMGLGIHRASLFPDRDGIASYTNSRFSV